MRVFIILKVCLCLAIGAPASSEEGNSQPTIDVETVHAIVNDVHHVVQNEKPDLVEIMNITETTDGEDQDEVPYSIEDIEELDDYFNATLIEAMIAEFEVLMIANGVSDDVIATAESLLHDMCGLKNEDDVKQFIQRAVKFESAIDLDEKIGIYVSHMWLNIFNAEIPSRMQRKLKNNAKAMEFLNSEATVEIIKGEDEKQANIFEQMSKAMELAQQKLDDLRSKNTEIYEEIFAIRQQIFLSTYERTDFFAAYRYGVKTIANMEKILQMARCMARKFNDDEKIAVNQAYSECSAVLNGEVEEQVNTSAQTKRGPIEELLEYPEVPVPAMNLTEILGNGTEFSAQN